MKFMKTKIIKVPLGTINGTYQESGIDKSKIISTNFHVARVSLSYL